MQLINEPFLNLKTISPSREISDEKIQASIVKALWMNELLEHHQKIVIHNQLFHRYLVGIDLIEAQRFICFCQKYIHNL